MISPLLLAIMISSFGESQNPLMIEGPSTVLKSSLDFEYLSILYKIDPELVLRGQQKGKSEILVPN